MSGFYLDQIPVTDEMVAAYGQAWMNTPKGAVGTRTRAGLEAALKVYVDAYNLELRKELDPDSL
jgi:hypothetical protein